MGQSRQDAQLESKYQARLIEKIQDLLPGCFIFRGNPRDYQGIPDLLILHGPNWAQLEVKTSEDAYHEPNQDYYIDTFNRMSFAAFIFPENEEDVLHALQRAFGTRGQARLPVS